MLRLNLAKRQSTPTARGRIAAYGTRLANLEPAFLRSGVVALTTAQGRIRDQDGGQWAPTVEQEHGSALYRSGSLFRSLQPGGPANLMQEIPGGVRVGTNLRTPGGRYSIGRLMQYGTGPIEAKPGKLLVFEVNGHKVFAKRTRGIPPRPFLFFDDALVHRVLGVFNAWMRGMPDVDT